MYFMSMSLRNLVYVHIVFPTNRSLPENYLQRLMLPILVVISHLYFLFRHSAV